MRRPPRKGKRRRGDDVTSSEFTLFQLLDTNVGDRNGDDDGSDYSDETDEEEGKTDEKEATHSLTFETSTKPSSGPQSIFEALFAQSEKAQREQQNEKSAEKTESVPVNESLLASLCFVKSSDGLPYQLVLYEACARPINPYLKR